MQLRLPALAASLLLAAPIMSAQTRRPLSPDLIARETKPDSPLIAAVRAEDLGRLMAVLNGSYAQKKRDPDLDNALCLAIPLSIDKNRPVAMKMVKALIDQGANVNAKWGNAEPALHVAIHRMAPDAVDMLLARGADPNGRDADSRTPLIGAFDRGQITMRGTPKIVASLLKKGANVNSADKNGVTALMNASRSCSPEVVTLLLDHHADVRAVDRAGNTALLYTAMGDNVEAMTALLKRGADAKVRNHSGLGAIAIAKEAQKGIQAMRFPQAEKILKAAGATE